MTALMSAAARAAHPLVDAPPPLWSDPVAARLCRTSTPSPLDFHLAQPDVPVLAAARLSSVTRTAFAFARLRESTLTQYIVLGAGLDTSAHAVSDDSVRTWLVDLPGVLAWRADLFAAAGIDDVGTPVPVDLARDDAVDSLTRAGLDLERPVFVAWLGVSMYLDEASVRSVLVSLARLGAGSHLVFDHLLPAGRRDAAGDAYVQAVGVMAGSSGEPWRTTPTPEQADVWLHDAGWTVAERIGEAEAAGPGSWPRSDALQPMRLVEFVHALLSAES